jgi:glycosyltransferase involved in cell wall biosynthesis
LFVGRFDKHKGGDLVIDAFVQLAAKHPKLELNFAGPDRGIELGDGTKMSLPQYIETKVKSDDVRKRLHVLGPQPAAAIARLRKSAAVTMVASRYENAPMTIVEGLAFASPLVVSDAGGNPELVANEETGLTFRAGDASDLAAKVDALLADPTRARTLAAAARNSYEKRLTPAVVASAMAEYYRSVLDRA